MISPHTSRTRAQGSRLRMSCLVGTTRAGPLGRRVESTRRTRSHPRARAVVAASRRGEDEGGAHARLAPSRARTRIASRDDASCSRVERSAVDVQYDPAPAPSTSYLRPETLVLSAVVMNAAYATAALAYEGYDGIGVPDDEATPLQNAFGLVFTVFCGWYFLRVVKKRGNRAKEFRVANTLPVRPLPHTRTLRVVAVLSTPPALKDVCAIPRDIFAYFSPTLSLIHI